MGFRKIIMIGLMVKGKEARVAFEQGVNWQGVRLGFFLGLFVCTLCHKPRDTIRA